MISRLFPGAPAATFVILTYHSVYDDQKELFRKQMNILKKYGHAVFPDGTGYKKGNRHHVAVTFDDGYSNVLENAVPVLKECDIPATIFVTTGKLGQTPDWILHEDNRDTEETIVSVQELLQLDKNLIMVGSHTVTHKNLAEVDEDTIRYELTESRRSLEALLGVEISLLAFPFGAYNQKVLSIARETGYKKVFSNIPRVKTRVSEKEDDGFLLCGRISVTPLDGALEFHLKCAGAYQWLPVAINLKRKINLLVNAVFTLFKAGKYSIH